MEQEAVKHQLYVTGDRDAPEVICDRNGEVVLGLCKVCGLGEIELDRQPDCPGRKVRRVENATIQADRAERDLAILHKLHELRADADVVLLERAEPETMADLIAGLMHRHVIESEAGHALPELTAEGALGLMTARQRLNARLAGTHLVALLEKAGYVIARKLPGEG